MRSQNCFSAPPDLENGPKTESCDSGVIVLSKHSNEQTQKIPELLLNKNKKSLHASVMAEALHKMQKEYTTLPQRDTPCHLSLNTDTKTKQESCYSGRIVIYLTLPIWPKWRGHWSPNQLEAKASCQNNSEAKSTIDLRWKMDQHNVLIYISYMIQEIQVQMH